MNKKPKATTTILHPHYGNVVSVPAFATESQHHNAMRDWANSKRVPPLLVHTTYKDGSFEVEVIDPVQKEVEYKTVEGEVYTVLVDINRYKVPLCPDDSTLTKCRFKSAYMKVLNNGSLGDCVESIKVQEMHI